MNLQEKVKMILSYCGKYIGHQSMIFERLENLTFNVKFAEEADIENNLAGLKVIFLTGEAGDGKSHLLNNLRGSIDASWEFCEDFSAISKETQRDLILNAIASIENISTQKYVIAANMGVLLSCLMENAPDLIDALQNKIENVKIINFEKRNIAKDFTAFKSFIHEFLKYDAPCPNTACSYYSACPFQKNIEYIKKDESIFALQALCNAIFLTGGHLTVRELLSLFSYMITNGKFCTDLNIDKINIYNIFDDEENILLRKFFMFDPAKARVPDKLLSDSKASIIEKLRYDFFFSKPTDKLSLLPVLYLSEYNSFINMLASSGGYIDVKDENEICKKLKYGLLKMISKDASFGEIVLQDSPTYLGEKIKIQFHADFNKISLFWTHIDFDIEKFQNKSLEINNEPFSCSKLNLSCVYKNSKHEDQIINLAIDYNSFKYILMNYDDYYTFSENFSTQAYGFTGFFIKILQNNPDFYRQMSVLFDRDLLDEYIDFDLGLYKTSLDPDEKITLKKRDRR